jgi:hypothetical protein
MRAERKRSRRSAKTVRERLEEARAEALRGSFLLGGSMQDLKPKYLPVDLPLSEIRLNCLAVEYTVFLF